jgi:heptaprenyl diphosphate synthase
MVPAVLTGLAFDDPALEASVRADLQRVEARLRDASVSNYGFLDETAHHLSEAGGKRFRSLVTLLAAHAAVDLQAGAAPEPVLGAAVAIELTHLSTLYHDDVMDEATFRRGAEAANRRWTNTVAILTGDYLFARASELTADLGAEATRVLARTIATLVEGQIRETVGPQAGDDVLEHYLRVVAEKTGSLIATAGRLGARLAGGSPQRVEVLTRYAAAIGTAFQLADDILDVTSASFELGKTQGTDLREGILSLPVVLAAKIDPDVYAQVRGDLSHQPDFDAALDALRASAAMDEARAMASRWAEQAREALTDLPAGAPRSALSALCDVAVTRTH